MKTRILSLIAALLVTGPLGIAQEHTVVLPRGGINFTAPALALQGDKDIHVVRSTGYMQIPPGSQIRFNLDPVSLNLFPPELVMRNQKAIELEGEQKTFIRQEILKAQTRFTELQWDLEDARETLDSLLEKGQANEQQVLTQLDKVLDAERTIKRNQIQLMVRIKNRLTSDQQAKLKQVSRKGLHGIFMEGRRHEGLEGLHEIRIERRIMTPRPKIERRIKSHKPGTK